MKTIVVLNAPPSAGKDTLAPLIKDIAMTMAGVDATLLSFKSPMWDIAYAVLGEKKFNDFKALYDNRDTKEVPCDFLGGFSPRQFFIHISEKWCKPVFGDEYFGDRLRDSAISANGAVVTDGGFPDELLPVIYAGFKVMIVRIHRKGCTYAGDSRNYIRDDAYDSLPRALRPTFYDVHVVEGKPELNAVQIATEAGWV
ncbi:MAG: hypothetical protein [Caudoviricetes sp.]|nr:MAG: hypothetical protein [Caudoviricetes sp.]